MPNDLINNENAVVVMNYQKNDDIVNDVRVIIQNFSEGEIWQTRLPNLTWSHYNAL